MTNITSDKLQRRDQIIDAVEAICGQPATLSAAASGTAVSEPVTEWKHDVPRQASADKVLVDRC